MLSSVIWPMNLLFITFVFNLYMLISYEPLVGRGCGAVV